MRRSFVIGLVVLALLGFRLSMFGSEPTEGECAAGGYVPDADEWAC